MTTARLHSFYFIMLTTITFFSCAPGYEKEEGQWAFVSYNEGFGKMTNKMEVDENTFKVLSDREYAKDAYHVFHRGKLLELADAKTFSVINKKGYTKDKKHVFLDCIPIILANPATFEYLKFPYSRDDKFVFCGTIPMKVKNVKEFKVTASDGARTGTLKEIFIETNKEYAWLDTTDYDVVMYGYGKGKTKTEKFEGFKKTK